MASDHMLRIPRSDFQGKHILVNVSKNGPALLDLKLIGTEGTVPYLTTVKESDLSKLLSRNSPVTISQWETILCTILLQNRPSANTSEILVSLEVIASVVGDQLSIVFRKNISGIHQRVGEIALKQDESQEIDTVAWLETAICRGDTLEGEIKEISHKLREQNEVVKKLNLQIEDLIKSQQEFESSSLERFMVLLNAKKLKIRNQQRLLATAKIDSKTAQALCDPRSLSVYTPSGISRQNKRKPKTDPTVFHSTSEDSGFEDRPINEADPATPGESDLDTINDDDDELDTGPEHQSSKSGTGPQDKTLEGAAQVTDVQEPPPRRQLQFSSMDGKEVLGGQEANSQRVNGIVDEKGDDMEYEQYNNGDETSDDEL